MMPTWQILQGDARTQLRTLADESVQCVVTSPPYWGLRNYGVDGQLGLEDTPSQYVEQMVIVFREVRRVLRNDGVCWLNLGDSYAMNLSATAAVNGANTRAGLSAAATKSDGRARLGNRSDTHGEAVAIGVTKTIPHGLKPKDLVGVPWRVAFALQADGWYLRSDIIWSKPNPMPESVTDRPTKAHEYVFLLTKSERYFYDSDAIKEPQSAGTFERYKPGEKIPTFKKSVGSDRKNDSFAASTPIAILPDGRNCRSVWTITTQPYPEAHFATFPEALPERCIKAGTSERGQCPACGAPWKRQTETQYKRHEHWFGEKQGERHSRGSAGVAYNEPIGTRTTGWAQSCACDVVETVPQTVLDPFCGSGTTGYVAITLGRSFIGIELKPEYIEMARQRIGLAAPLFAREATEPVAHQQDIFGDATP